MISSLEHLNMYKVNMGSEEKVKLSDNSGYKNPQLQGNMNSFWIQI